MVAKYCIFMMLLFIVYIGSMDEIFAELEEFCTEMA